MNIQNSVDRTVNTISLGDALSSKDAPGAVAAALSLAATYENPNTALAFSIFAVQASIASISDKVTGNQGVKLSDVMAVQASVGSLLSSAAGYASGAVKNPKLKIGLGATGSVLGKASSVYAATAFTMSKTKADIAIWDPANKTGLPKITDIDGSKEKYREIGELIGSNFQQLRREYEKQLYDLTENKPKELVAQLGKDALPKLLNFTDVLTRALDPKTWEENVKSAYENLGDWLNDKRGEFGKWLLPKLYEQSEDLEKFFEWLNPFKRFDKEGKFYVTDPLVLDLDGDGIETVSHNGYKGALFDHDGNGIRTASGWVGKDDGLLVIDRNGDGVINDGRELFGDSYILKDGSKAAHGYAALAEYDENGDGKIDAQDADFAKLRVWRDLNQDGISQQDELFTLEEAGVQSLNAAYQDTNQNLGNGNRLAQEGSYPDKEGKERKMGDLLFGNNTLYSRYSASVKLTDEQRAAANLQGTGRLRDLREAAALSPALAAVLQAYSQAKTKAEQIKLLDDLVEKWAQTDPDYSVGTRFSAPINRTSGEGVALTPSQAAAMLMVGDVSDDYKEKLFELRTKIAALDAFSGEKSGVVYVHSKEQMENFLTVVRETYDKLTDNVYENLLFQTRLQPYLNKIGLKLEDGEFKLDFTDVAALFGEIYAQNPEKAFVDLGEFLAYSRIGAGDKALAELSSLMVQYSADAVSNGTFEQYVEALGKEAMEKLGHKTGTEKADRLYGNESANFMTGGDGMMCLMGMGEMIFCTEGRVMIPWKAVAAATP